MDDLLASGLKDLRLVLDGRGSHKEVDLAALLHLLAAVLDDDVLQAAGRQGLLPEVAGQDLAEGLIQIGLVHFLRLGRGIGHHHADAAALGLCLLARGGHEERERAFLLRHRGLPTGRNGDREAAFAVTELCVLGDGRRKAERQGGEGGEQRTAHVCGGSYKGGVKGLRR